MADVDATFELGAKVGYTFDWIRPWAAVRYGLGGHSGIVGETGLDFIFRPSPVFQWAVGPRASFANRDYMETYFGVTPAESALSGTLAAYSPGGGFKGVGAELTARYEFAPQWAIRAEFQYEKLIGSAVNGSNGPAMKRISHSNVSCRLIPRTVSLRTRWKPIGTIVCGPSPKHRSCTNSNRKRTARYWMNNSAIRFSPWPRTSLGCGMILSPRHVNGNE